MPLPFLLAGAAIVAGVGGVGTGIHGGVKIKDATDTMEHAKGIMEDAQESVEKNNKKALNTMDKIGKRELEILSSFKEFSDLIEKIQGRPEFKNYKQDKYDIPEYNPEKLKKVALDAKLLLGGLGGTAAGTVGGIAAAGSVSDLTLAALGGGTIAVGGGGAALGTAIIGGATLGIGLLVGGIIFNFTGNKMSDKADEAYSQAKKAQKDAEKIVGYLSELNNIANKFYNAINSAASVYEGLLSELDKIINYKHKILWSEYNDSEKLLVENLALMVGILYKSCQTNIVKENKNTDNFNEINNKGITEAIEDCQKVVIDIKAS